LFESGKIALDLCITSSVNNLLVIKKEECICFNKIDLSIIIKL